MSKNSIIHLFYSSIHFYFTGVVYDGTQPYNSQSLPLSELRKLQLSDDDRSFMNRVKSQGLYSYKNLI